MKDEGANLKTLTITLSSIMSCVPLLLPQPYVTNCYEYAMSKCCLYAINDLKMWFGMKEASIKLAIGLFSKDDHLDKKKWEGKIEMGKGLHRCISSPLEIEDSCQDLGGFQNDIIQRNFGIQKSHKFVLFIVYNYFEKHNFISAKTQCVLNQSQGYWLLFNVNYIAITMCVMMYNTNFNVNDGMQICGFDCFFLLQV